jgi:hypothetical protein
MMKTLQKEPYLSVDITSESPLSQPKGNWTILSGHLLAYGAIMLNNFVRILEL